MIRIEISVSSLKDARKADGNQPEEKDREGDKEEDKEEDDKEEEDDNKEEDDDKEEADADAEVGIRVILSEIGLV